MARDAWSMIPAGLFQQSVPLMSSWSRSQSGRYRDFKAVERLLQSDMAIQIIAPVSLDALEPFPFDQAFETPAHMRLVLIILRSDGIEIHAAKELQGGPLPAKVRAFSFAARKRFRCLFHSIADMRSIPCLWMEAVW